MKFTIVILGLALSAGPMCAVAQHQKQTSGLDKVLHSMFPSTKAKVVKPTKPKPTKPKPTKPKPTKPKPKSEIENKPEQKPDETKDFAVEPDWMARYWELEAAWNYYIPEDNQIAFKDGKYIVPFLVRRHYEDMSNAAARRE